MLHWQRKSHVVAMICVVVGMVSVTGYQVGPSYYFAWRERTLRSAFEARTGPQRWWPTSWWQDYDRHIEVANELAEREKACAASAWTLKAHKKFAAEVPGSPAATRFESLAEKERQKFTRLTNEVESLQAELARW